MLREGIAINKKNWYDLDFFTWISYSNSLIFLFHNTQTSYSQTNKKYKAQVIELEN